MPALLAEVRAIAARPNVCGYNAFHTSGGVLLRPSSVKSDKQMLPLDLYVWNEFGRRGTALTGGAAGLAGAVDGTCITPFRLDVSRHVIAPEGTAGGAPSLRVAHVSDLHLSRIGAREEAVLHALDGLAADLIVLTGDSIDRAAGLGALSDFLAACPAAPARLLGGSAGSGGPQAASEVFVLQGTLKAR